MRFQKFAFGLAFSLAMSATSPAAAEDLTVFFKATGGTNVTTASYRSATRTRNDHDHYTNINDVADGKFIMININHQKREYYEDTLEEIEAATQRAKQRMEEQKAKLKLSYPTMSPEHSKAVRAILAERREAASIEKIPGHRRIAGHDCEHYVLTLTLLLDGDVEAITKYDYWIAPDLREPPSGWPSVRESEFARVSKELAHRGFSLAATMTTSTPATSDSPQVLFSNEAIEVKKGPIDPSVFAVPAGYTKVASPFTKDAQ